MATPWTWKQHDTWPPGYATIEAPNKTTGKLEAVDLSAAVSVKIVARAKTDNDPTAPLFKVAVNAYESGGAPEKGEVEYIPQAAHTEKVQELNGEFEVDWGGGKIQSFPAEGYFPINITDDLG